MRDPDLELPCSPACERNREPILGHLRAAFANARRVLELGSGTGQHAVHFASALPHVEWQPTDVPDNLPALARRIAIEGPPNLRHPKALDVRERPWTVMPHDAAFTANTLHIMGWPAVEDFFAGLGETLAPRGVLCVYGPFRYGGRYTSDSNAAFDQHLQARDPASGIRDFAAVDELARGIGLELVADHAMPANNQLLHWVRRDGAPSRT